MNHRILIVDDNPTNVAIVEELLGDSYVLAVAQDGEQALEMVPQFNPDLVLLDIMMPGIDGYEVCRRLRRDPNYRFVKIVLVSAKAMTDERLRGYEVGADDYVTKPFVAEELQAKVRVFLRLQSAEEMNHLSQQLDTVDAIDSFLPISNIKTALRKLESEASDERRRALVTQGLEHCARLQHQHQQRRRLFRARAGQISAKLEETDTGYVIEKVISALNDYATRHNVLLVPPQRREQVIADATLLEEVISTLLRGAIHNSPHLNVVSVSLDRVDASIVFGVESPHLALDPEHHLALTKSRLPSLVRNYGRGHSLDLLIARELVALMNGELETDVDSGMITFRLAHYEGAASPVTI